MDRFRCVYVTVDDSKKTKFEVTSRPVSELPNEETLIRVNLSSLNYKDALALHGNPGVAKTLPHVPGIDAAGTVVETGSSDLVVGQEVIVTGNELGAGQWGGWAELIRVPSDWVVALPSGMTQREAMIHGTAGFTAAQCVRELIRNEITPDKGPVIVTGATGGVGCLAVKLLSKLGYHIIAVTGKRDAHDWLKQLGANEILGREDVVDDGKKPLLSTRWAGGVDTVGGETLSFLIRSTDVNGCISACGLVAGHVLPITVFPFILRGVRLAGITSSLCPRAARLEVWEKLNSEWALSGLEDLVEETDLDGVGEFANKILQGRIRGRILVQV